MSAVIGLVADAAAWKQTAVVLQQLRDVKTTLPAIVFNTTELSHFACAAFSALGGIRVSLTPEMPVPPVFRIPLKKSHGNIPAWRKLALWAQTSYEKIIYLDYDVLIMKNIDHMAAFPVDAFTPEVCSYPKCLPDKIPAGLNVGVMIIGPSKAKYDGLQRYAHERAVEMAAIPQANESERERFGRFLLGSAEQSFLREFYEDRMNASISSANESRRGWDWDTVTFVESGPCKRHVRRDPTWQGCVPAPVHVLSRRYNARPLDCARCPADIDNVIIHYACTIKPWQRTRSDWEGLKWCKPDMRAGGNVTHPLCEPCLIGLAQRWFSAEDRMCAELSRAAAASSSLSSSYEHGHHQKHSQEWYAALDAAKTDFGLRLALQELPACAAQSADISKARIQARLGG